MYKMTGDVFLGQTGSTTLTISKRSGWLTSTSWWGHSATILIKPAEIMFARIMPRKTDAQLPELSWGGAALLFVVNGLICRWADMYYYVPKMTSVSIRKVALSWQSLSHLPDKVTRYKGGEYRFLQCASRPTRCLVRASFRKMPWPRNARASSYGSTLLASESITHKLWPHAY